jgi:ATP-dependent DNA helicase RecQ
LRCVLELGSFAGPTYTTLVLTGSREERVTAKGHHRLKAFGALSEHEPRTVRDWIEQLAGQGYLTKTGEYNILNLTPRGHDALGGRDVPMLTDSRRGPRRKAVASEMDLFGAGASEDRPRSRKASRTALKEPPGPVDRGRFETLRVTRKAIADDLAVPAFVVFSDATLRDMAARKPRDRLEFLDVHGVGRQKCEAFADAFLKTIQEYGESGA